MEGIYHICFKTAHETGLCACYLKFKRPEFGRQSVRAGLGRPIALSLRTAYRRSAVNMKLATTLHLFLVGTLIAFIAGCDKAPMETSADSSMTNSAGLPEKTAAEPKVTMPEPKPKVMVPAGTQFHVVLIDDLNTAKNAAGDSFLASLSEAVVMDGKTILAKGTKVQGRVVDVNESGRVKGRASIRLVLNRIVREDHKSVEISTKPYTAVAESTKKRDAGIIAGGAGVGAAIGAIAGGGKGAAIGAALGGGAGSGAVLATKGKEIHYPPETRLTFNLASPVEL